jgi:small-conductance mechanosensitive channel
MAAGVVAIAIFAFYHLVIRAARALTKAGKLNNSFTVIRRLCRWFCVIVGTMLILQTLGWLQDAWTTITAVFTLVAVGFVAVWSVLSHILSSLILMIAGPFGVGDTIEFADDPDLRGEVVDFSLFFTMLQADNGDLVQVPNNIFFQKAIRRRPGDPARSLDEQLEREPRIQRRLDDEEPVD